MDDCFSYENFFSKEDLDRIENSVQNREPGVDQVMPYGPFANKLIANSIPLNDDAELIAWLHQKIAPTVDQEFVINRIFRVKLFLPWDVHCDFYQSQCLPGHIPYYCFLIPLNNVQSRTIIFDQCTDGSDAFSDYKDKYGKSANPPTEEFWQENLSMCWPHDREYVSIKKVMPFQTRGQLNGFPCKNFHSSDNFHTKFEHPKEFIQIRTGTMNRAI